MVELSPPLVSVEHVHVQFGHMLAVRDVSFQLRAGDLLGLIGPNGAGKTTLLRTLAALQPIHVGRIRIMDELLRPDAHEVLRHIGFTPDTPPFYEELTVRDFLRFVGMGYDLPRRETDERIEFWLDKVWLREKADTKIKSLSRGMKQRVGIARTLLPNPSVILLDEPSAGLDPAGRVQFRQLLCNLRDQGKALIVSSHILSDMADYCTHAAIMSRGRMVQFGTVSNIAASTADGHCRYTMFLSRPVNGLKETLAHIDGLNSVEIDNQRIVFEYFSNPDRATSLLAQLVRQKIPIASFAPNTAGLEEAYLRAGIGPVD